MVIPVDAGDVSPILDQSGNEKETFLFYTD
jgi:hypothetical protein